jgi:hypothetical protein
VQVGQLRLQHQQAEITLCLVLLLLLEADLAATAMLRAEPLQAAEVVVVDVGPHLTSLARRAIHLQLRHRKAIAAQME